MPLIEEYRRKSRECSTTRNDKEDGAMRTAGIDIGTRTVKVALADEESGILSRAWRTGGFDPLGAAAEALAEALEIAKLTRSMLDTVAAVGEAAGELGVDRVLTEVGAAARGVREHHPEARLVVDVGAESARAIRLSEDGRVLDFAMNEKCAAGAGAFLDSMARVLDATVEDLDRFAEGGSGQVKLNSQCVVFAESEVVSLLHRPTPKEDIARAIADSIASRTAVLVRRVGLETPLVVTGGMACSRSFVHALAKELGVADCRASEDPLFSGAEGAALLALAGKGERS